MTPALTDHTVPFAGRLHREDCNIDDLAALVAHRTDLAEYPYAHSVADGVLLYHSAALVEQSSNPEIRAEIQDEIARALLTGPGITVFQGAFDAEILDRASEIFRQLIARQHESGAKSGDHFAKPGANDRIWGAQLKLALEDPKAYVDYYANSIVALASEAWLGPMYQVTSDVNVVNPGGAAQNPHRDYHLGFMSSDVAAKFRAHVHRLTPALTLQGAVAHVDMPVETGPTKYLPYSQQFESGYLAFERPEFKEFFEANYVQLPLEKGDAVFFNLHCSTPPGTTNPPTSCAWQIFFRCRQPSVAPSEPLTGRRSSTRSIRHCSPSAKQVPTSPFAVPSPLPLRATPSRPIWTETNRSTASRLRRRPN